MIISGKVYSITQVNDDITRIVLIKSRNKKEYYVSIMTYYHFSDVIRDKYLMGDYVKIWFRLRSNQRMSNDNKPIYYTDVIGEKIVFLLNGKKAWEGSNKDIFNTDNEAVSNFVYSSDLFKKVRKMYLEKK